MGFANWNHEPIFDKWAWEEVPKSKQWEGYDDDVNRKFRNLNKDCGGEGIDKFIQGVIQNRKDKNTTSLDQNPNCLLNNEGINAPSSSGSNIAKIYPLDSNGNPQDAQLGRD